MPDREEMGDEQVRVMAERLKEDEKKTAPGKGSVESGK